MSASVVVAHSVVGVVGAVTVASQSAPVLEPHIIPAYTQLLPLEAQKLSQLTPNVQSNTTAQPTPPASIPASVLAVQYAAEG